MGSAEVTYFLGNSRPVHYLRGIAIRFVYIGVQGVYVY